MEPIKITDNKKCSGCSACYNKCPVEAIEMLPDKEGFLYPEADKGKCIGCGLCVDVCPYYKKNIVEEDKQLCFAAFNKSEKEREISSSGGIFVLLAKEIIKNNGVVFGAAYDRNFMVYHTGVENCKDLLNILGSKYVQSKVGDSYKKVEVILKQNREVLFAGTTCQIGGLRSYLGKVYPKLYCIDFICLGVPSPQVWEKYLKTFFDDTETVNFKDKTRGWHRFSLDIKGKNTHFNRDGRNTYYFTGYFNGLYSRPSCSECIFKEGNRISDITLADCWGYPVIAPELDDNKGLSSIVIHSAKGIKLFEAIKKDLVLKKSEINLIKKYNENYCKSAPLGNRREEFWSDMDRLPYKNVCKKYCEPIKSDIISRIERKMVEVLKIYKNKRHL